MVLSTQPQPTNGEAYEAFVVRAHQELMPSIPEPMERNRVVWNAWESANGDPERYRAREFFPSDRYRRVDDVCYWHEHTAATYDAAGNPTERSNDVNRLIAVARENNMRIADTDSFSAIVDKHTRPASVDRPDDPNPPRTLGHPGPFRLGMIGRKSPKFALFADEFQRIDKQDVLRDRPRRSVEVLTLKANGRSYIDPIAALSESPRLPLPLTAHYSADSEDFYVDRFAADEVERYEGESVDAGGALPGGSNTYLPGGGESRKKKHERYCSNCEDDPNNPMATENRSQNPEADKGSPMYGTQPQDTPAPAGGGNVNDETARGIIDALMSLPFMQAMYQMWQSGQMGGGDQAQQEPQPAAPAAPPAQAPQQQENFIAGMGLMDHMDKLPSTYSADSSEADVEYELEPEVSVERFAALQADVQKLMQENAQLRTNQVELAAENADTKRSARLDQLHSRYPHFIDLEKERSRVLYSAGSTMNDHETEEHFDMLESYAQKAPPLPGSSIPTGDFGPEQRNGIETDRYEADVSQRATEIFTREQDAKRFITAEEAYARAKQEIESAA